MTQVTGLRQQDWAAYQDGSSQWALLEEMQAADESTGTSNAGASSGAYGAANNAGGGCGTWTEAPPPPPLTYVTIGYTEWGDPICVPVEAPQAPTAPAPAPITYSTVGYTHYGDPICAPLSEAPVPTTAPSPLPMYTVSYDQGNTLAHDTVYPGPTPAPVSVAAPAPVPVYQSYDQGDAQVYTSVYEASPTPAVSPSVPVASQGESGEPASGDSLPATHGTRRRPQDFDGGSGTFDSFGANDHVDTDFGVSAFDAGGQDAWGLVNSEFDADNADNLFDGSLYSDPFDNDPFDSDPFDNDPFDWSQNNAPTEAYGPFVPGIWIRTRKGWVQGVPRSTLTPDQ